MKQLFRSKKFWTLIAAIVTALTVFFCSCTGYQKIIRDGVHHDTVRYEQFIKHKNFVSCLTSLNETFNSVTGTFTRPFVPFIEHVPISLRTPNRFLFDSNFPALLSCSTPLIVSPIINSPTFIARLSNCSTLMLTSTSRSRNAVSGIVCSVCMIPAAFPVRSRRGGRKGRPRPNSGTKTIPLGGSRL